MVGNGDAISRLPASQVREMREGFEILDRDGDGLVDREDVVDMLTNLGIRFPPNPAFFYPLEQPKDACGYHGRGLRMLIWG